MEYHAICNSVFNYTTGIKYDYDISQFDYCGNILVKALVKKGSKILRNYKSASCISTTPTFQIACFVGQRYYIIEEIVVRKTIKKKVASWKTDANWSSDGYISSLIASPGFYDEYIQYEGNQPAYQPIITVTNVATTARTINYNDIHITYDHIDENH